MQEVEPTVSVALRSLEVAETTLTLKMFIVMHFQFSVLISLWFGHGLFGIANIWYRVWSCHSWVFRIRVKGQGHMLSAHQSPKYPYCIGNWSGRLQRRLQKCGICRLLYYKMVITQEWLAQCQAAFKLQCIAIAIFHILKLYTLKDSFQ